MREGGKNIFLFNLLSGQKQIFHFHNIFVVKFISCSLSFNEIKSFELRRCPLILSFLHFNYFISLMSTKSSPKASAKALLYVSLKLLCEAQSNLILRLLTLCFGARGFS